MKKSLLLISIIPLLLTSCNGNEGKTNDKFTVKTINVNYVNEKNNTTCDIRYYNGSVIPYISLKEYRSLLFRGRTFKEGRDILDVTKKNNVYTFKIDGGSTATFDTKNNKMESDNLLLFKNTSYFSSDMESFSCTDNMPFVKTKGIKVEGTPKKTTIDFNKYNLKFYGDKNDVYVPIAFASDLYSGENILQGAFNTEDLYILDYLNNESIYDFGGKYFDPIFAKPLNEEYVAYYYNESCLNYDYFNGRTGRSTLERYYDLSNGLDAALKSRPAGRHIIECMHSTDLATLLAGGTLLGLLRRDGGHTDYSPYSTAYYDPNGEVVCSPWLSDEVYDAASKIISDAFYDKKYEEVVNYEAMVNHYSELKHARSIKLGKEDRDLKGTETYTKDGDIAYIHIDGFMDEVYLRDEWGKYYRGEIDTIPFGDGYGGAVGAITTGVKKAAADDEIKHIVVDLSANTGGSTDEMLFMVGLLTGSRKLYNYNRLIDVYLEEEYAFDFNFDRVFDEKDDEVRNLLKGKDISVLTSSSAFSCGNTSPIYLHDNGIFTIGENCGGGSCSIIIQVDAFGITNVASSNTQTVNKNKISTDAARKTVCDYPLEFPLVKEEKDGETYEYIDYSSLYDSVTLRKAITEHY